jgi:oligoribonuclease
MKIICVDIETTGLDPEKHQIIEFAALIGDIATGEELAQFQCLVDHEQYSGDPFALAMNAEILREIAEKNRTFLDPDEQSRFVGRFHKPEYVWDNFLYFLKGHWGPIENSRPTVAGKNFAGFDLLFLSKLPKFKNPFNHRVFDPGSIFYQPGDKKLPDLATCLKRAGLEGAVKHRALDDCRDVFNLLCYVHRNPIKVV